MTTRDTAAEECAHCRQAVWADPELELFVTAEGEFECAAAPLIVNPAGAQYPPVLDVHTP